MNTGKRLIVLVLLFLCIGLGASHVSAAAPFVPIYTMNNNFTILDSNGATVGGTNDVLFTWDGTLKTAVAVSGQVANATIYSKCPFNGFTWKAHDVAVYGPGTYTVNASCASKLPGCATGTNPITFTVGPDEIGAHILFDWGTVTTNKNIDVVNVWQKSSPFGPSSMWTGACGSNSASAVWDLMSRDAGAGINGYPMVDGGFVGFHANFNMMGPVTNRVVDTSNNNFTMIDPVGGLVGGTNDVRFTWDGTMKTAVPVSGGLPNATLTSPCPFSGFNWFAHDVTVYGPGTYTVYTGCTGGNPGCGVGASYTFTVNPNEIGVHILFNWGSFSSATPCGLTNCDIDVVDVMRPGMFADGVNLTVCTPNPMWTGACGVGNAAQVWDHMSYDWDGDCLNGAAMVDGPFAGFNANFNLMNPPPCTGFCDDGDACTIDTYGVNCVCEHITIPNCCNTASDCSDNNACTTDACVSNACVYTPIGCNDNNACTADSCDPATGCVHTPINCNDSNACTIDTCNSATGCVYTPNVVCNDNNPCTTDTCDPATGNCVFIPRVCNDGNPCTVDTCDPVTGNCVFTPIAGCNYNGPRVYVPVYTTNNNFTMLDPTGATVGGTNDVLFTWDGTMKTAVAVSGQVSNATIYSNCPFNGFTWKAHDVAIYGPGTYTVMASCAAKLPGCATGTNPITFTVGPDEIGAHILFDWGTVTTNKNIDVVNVWKKNLVFGPSPMWTGACGSNSASTVWDLMSRDAGAGINGYPMVDGGFVGFHANFNMMGPVTNRVVDTSNNNFTMIDPVGGLVGGTNDVRFTWDGTMKTAVPVSGGIPNATLTSPCPFVGNNWFAHDVTVYGPGTYTVYTGCTGGNPGCGIGIPYTFTVNANEIGAHLLFNWGSFSATTPCGLHNCDIDVVDVMRQGTFASGVDPTFCTPNPMWTGVCGSNADTTVWDYMSYDWDGDCINGAPMVDGPFAGFNANFNMMGVPPLCDCCIAPICNAGGPCTVGTCDTATGTCSYSARDCNDNNACTTDTCDTVIGCVHAPIICNDNNACTIDSCDPVKGCVHTPIVCNDNNVCTTDTCNPTTGCVFTPIQCPHIPCSNDTCNPVTGCPYDPVDCSDGNACTTDYCNTATDSCAHIVINCDDNNACTADFCNTATGCIHTPIICNDNNVCTTDSCNTAIGCVYIPIANCCNTAADCNDNNACTRDTCVNNACVHTPIYCCDACEPPNTCNPLYGCPLTIVCWPSCNDNNACTIDSCNSATGSCVFTPVNCNDNNACTTDSCDPVKGCVHTPIVCNDNNACTTDTCNPATGCVFTSNECPGDACTTVTCNPTTGCVFTPINCNDNNACTTDTCNTATGCVHTPIICNDNNACTTDSCNPGTGCIYTPVQCPMGYVCDPATGNCVNQNRCAGVICNDNNTCTADFCDPATGACVYAPAADGTACTVNSQAGTCTAGQCIASPVCPAGMVKSITVRGGGQKPTSVDLEIQTNFTVENDGCVGAAASGVICTPGTIMLVNVNAGIGPMPSSCTWKGASISTDSLFTIECPAVSGDVGKLICDNKLSGGKDVDRITVTVQ